LSLCKVIIKGKKPVLVIAVDVKILTQTQNIVPIKTLCLVRITVKFELNISKEFHKAIQNGTDYIDMGDIILGSSLPG